MTKIRQWLKRSEDCLRTYVEIEEKEEKREEQRVVALDVRHGVLPFVGRRVSAGVGNAP